MGAKPLTIQLHSDEPFLLHHVTTHNLTYVADAGPNSQVNRVNVLVLRYLHTNMKNAVDKLKV